MKKRLYFPYEEARKDDLKSIDITIRGRMVHHDVFPNLLSNGQPDPESYYEFSKRFFDYERDLSYINEFPDLKLNTRLQISRFERDEYSGDGSTIGGKIGYIYLSPVQRFILDWRFGKTSLQDPLTRQWLLGILLTATLTLLAALTLGQ